MRVLASRIKGKGEEEEVLSDFWDYTCDLAVKTAFWRSNTVQQLKERRALEEEEVVVVVDEEREEEEKNDQGNSERKKGIRARIKEEDFEDDGFEGWRQQILRKAVDAGHVKYKKFLVDEEREEEELPSLDNLLTWGAKASPTSRLSLIKNLYGLQAKILGELSDK